MLEVFLSNKDNDLLSASLLRWRRFTLKCRAQKFYERQLVQKVGDAEYGIFVSSELSRFAFTGFLILRATQSYPHFLGRAFQVGGPLCTEGTE